MEDLLESLNNLPKPPSTIQPTPEQDLERRLQALKPSSNSPALKTDEAHAKFEQLFGKSAWVAASSQPTKAQMKSTVIAHQPERSEADLVDELMNMIQVEVDLDEKHEAFTMQQLDGQREKLDRLKNDSTVRDVMNGASSSTVPENDEPEETPFKIDETEDDESDDGSDGSGSMCTVCTNRAVWRCQPCDNDPYCGDCFKECHQGEEMKQHRPVKIKTVK